MALAYPEGECFFDRSGLVAPRPHGYNANNPDHFHSHMMIEYIWNRPAQEWHALLGLPLPGAEVVRGRTSLVYVGTRDSKYWGNYRDLPISYGPSESTIRRRLHHDLCLRGPDFDTYIRGEAAEVWNKIDPEPEIL